MSTPKLEGNDLLRALISGSILNEDAVVAFAEALGEVEAPKSTIQVISSAPV